MKFYTRYFLCPFVLFITLGCLDTNAQTTKPDAHKNNTTVKPTTPDNRTPVVPAVDDSVIEERLVALALNGPLYDATFHEVKIADYKVKAERRSWFNLLTLSFNLNDQTFAAPAVAGTQYVYPKYFFGLVIPVGTIVSKGSEIKGAKEGVKIAQDNRDNMARTIRADILSKYTEYKTYRFLVVLESQVTDDIHAAFLQAEKRFNDGSVTIEVYSDASRNYTAEMTKLLNLQLQQDLVKLEIEKIIGVKLETVLQDPQKLILYLMNAEAADIQQVGKQRAEKKSWVAKAFNTSILQKSRMAWVDYLKGIAILLVVYRHVLIGIQLSGISIPNSLVNANMIFYSFRMPLFFILSGIFISGSLARRTTGQLIYTKFENLLYPYLLWSFIQVTLQIAFNGSTNASRGFIDYTYILYQPRNMDQLWYLPALFNTTIIYLLVKTKLNPPGWTQLLFGLAVYFIAPHIDRISMLSDWMSFYFFFALGDNITVFFFKDSTQRMLKNPWSLAAVTPVFVLTQIFYLSQPQTFYSDTNAGLIEFMLIALIGCVCMCILAFRLQQMNILTWLRVLGYHSLYIYVMHVVVASATRLVLKNMLHIHNPVALLAAGIALGVTVPVICYNLFIFEKPGYFLFTLKKKKPQTQATRKTATPASLAS